eukprot:3536506-Rhodomonas_salina.1
MSAVLVPGDGPSGGGRRDAPVHMTISLPARYAVPGTDLAYGGTRRYLHQCATPCPVLTWYLPTSVVRRARGRERGRGPGEGREGKNGRRNAREDEESFREEGGHTAHYAELNEGARMAERRESIRARVRRDDDDHPDHHHHHDA